MSVVERVISRHASVRIVPCNNGKKLPRSMSLTFSLIRRTARCVCIVKPESQWRQNAVWESKAGGNRYGGLENVVLLGDITILHVKGAYHQIQRHRKPGIVLMHLTSCTGIFSETCRRFHCISLVIKVIRSQSHWIYVGPTSLLCRKFST